MKTTDINIAISGNEMIISEDNTTGEEYHIVDGSLSDTIEQITTCLADYLYNAYGDFIDQPPELKQWQKDILKKEQKENEKAEADVKPEARNHANGFNFDSIVSPNSFLHMLGIDLPTGKGWMKNDPVNHPSHYTDGKIEVIDFIEDKKLPFHLGNVVKYVSRAGKKDKTKTIEDLKKAQWYLNRYIQLLSSEGDTDGD